MKPKPTRVDEAVSAYKQVQYREDRLDFANEQLTRAVQGLTPEEMEQYVERTVKFDKERQEYAAYLEAIREARAKRQAELAQKTTEDD